MKRGVCVKCGSREVYASETGERMTEQHGVPVSGNSVAPVRYYSCTNCGYTETYITDSSFWTKIEKRWNRVAGPL